MAAHGRRLLAMGLPVTDAASDLEVSVERLAYPDCEGVPIDEQRRAFIAMHYLGGAAEYDGNIVVANMTMIDAWLRTGEGPKVDRKLKAVKP